MFDEQEAFVAIDTSKDCAHPIVNEYSNNEATCIEASITTFTTPLVFCGIGILG